MEHSVDKNIDDLVKLYHNNDSIKLPHQKVPKKLPKKNFWEKKNFW